MHFSFFGEKNFISWTLLISFLTFGHSDSVDLSDKSEDPSDLETWKKNLHLNDQLISKLYNEVNDFLIQKDLDKERPNYLKNNDDSFQVNIPNESSSERMGDDTTHGSTLSDESDHSKHKRSICYGFQDNLSCFRSYLALWMLQRQGLKDPISLRNIGKRAYSFRNVGKRGGLYSFRNIGKRNSAFFRNIGKRNAPDDEERQKLSKRDIRFPRSYYRNVGKRTADSFERNDRLAFRNIGKRMAFRNIGKKLAFRNIGKRNPLFERDDRMAFRNIGKKDSSQFERDDRLAFRNIGKRDPNFERDSRMAFRNIGKRDPLYERDSRMAFRNIGKRDPLFERDDRMAFRNIGKKDKIFDRDTRMSFRNIGKRDPTFERDDRMAFRNIGKRDEADLAEESSLSSSLQNDDEIIRTIRGSSFRNIGKRNNGVVVKDMSDVL